MKKAIHVTRLFFEASVPRANFFEKKHIFRYSHWECVNRIPGLYHFSLVRGQAQTHRHTPKYSSKYRYPYRLRASRGFENCPNIILLLSDFLLIFAKVKQA